MDEVSTTEADRRRAAAEAIAKQFDAMAARIRLNADDQFGGAFLMVPPANVGKAVELLALSNQNPGNFWMNLKLYIDQAYQEVADAARQSRVF